MFKPTTYPAHIKVVHDGDVGYFTACIGGAARVEDGNQKTDDNCLSHAYFHVRINGTGLPAIFLSKTSEKKKIQKPCNVRYANRRKRERKKRKRIKRKTMRKKSVLMQLVLTFAIVEEQIILDGAGCAIYTVRRIIILHHPINKELLSLQRIVMEKQRFYGDCFSNWSLQLHAYMYYVCITPIIHPTVAIVQPVSIKPLIIAQTKDGMGDTCSSNLHTK